MPIGEGGGGHWAVSDFVKPVQKASGISGREREREREGGEGQKKPLILLCHW